MRGPCIDPILGIIVRMVLRGLFFNPSVLIGASLRKGWFMYDLYSGSRSRSKCRAWSRSGSFSEDIARSGSGPRYVSWSRVKSKFGLRYRTCIYYWSIVEQTEVYV